MQSDFNNTSESNQEWAETISTHFYRAKFLLSQYAWIFLITVSLSIAYQTYKQMSRPDSYISHSEMIVSGRVSLPEGSLYKEELSNFFGTQIKLMKSNKVRTRAAERIQALNPDLEPAPVNISVSQSPRASIFLFQAQGPNPEYTQAFLNAVMKEYLNFKSQMRSQTTESTFLSITDKILQLKDEIDLLEDKKLEFQKANNLIFIKEQGNIAGTQLSALKNKLSQFNVRQQILNSEDLESFRTEEATIALDQLIKNPEFNLDVKEYDDLSHDVQKMEAERDEYASFMNENHPTIIALNSEISRKNNILRVIRRQKIEALIDKKEAIDYEIKNLELIVNDWEKKALNFSQKLAEYEQIESKLERLKNSQEQLLSSTQSIEINRNLEQESVAILENASPASMLPKNITKEIFMGGVFGVFIGAFIIAGIATVDSRIYSVEDLSQRYDEPIIGILPKLNPDESEVLLQHNDDRTAFSEALRNIRSSIIYLSREEKAPKTFLISSSVPSEGKSTIASNLAIALSFSASRVLLVDADLRRGRIHNKLSLKRSPGLYEAIHQKAKRDEYIQKTHIDDLDVITCGVTPDNPSETLMSSCLDMLLQEWKKDYDFIIFDSAPLLATNDSVNLATKLDGIIFVARSSITRTRQTKSALQALHMHGPEIYGFILNGVEATGPNYQYYKYSDYY